MNGCKAAADLRDALNDWRGRCGWSAEQISGALFMERRHDRLAPSVIDQFCRGTRVLRGQQEAAVRDFIARWPEPGPFAAWKDAVALEARLRKHAEIDALAARLDARDAARAAYVKACLAQEKPRLRSRWPVGVIPRAFRSGGGAAA